MQPLCLADQAKPNTNISLKKIMCLNIIKCLSIICTWQLRKQLISISIWIYMIFNINNKSISMHTKTHFWQISSKKMQLGTLVLELVAAQIVVVVFQLPFSWFCMTLRFIHASNEVSISLRNILYNICWKTKCFLKWMQLFKVTIRTLSTSSYVV